MASNFKKNYGVVDANFTNLKERCIINEIINQSIFQRTDKPLIEQTYLADVCCCDKKTIQRKLNKLEDEEWITKKRIKKANGYFTTQISITDKLKGIIKEIGREKKTTKKMKEKVINSIIPKIDDSPLSMERCNF